MTDDGDGTQVAKPARRRSKSKKEKTEERKRASEPGYCCTNDDGGSHGSRRPDLYSYPVGSRLVVTATTNEEKIPGRRSRTAQQFNPARNPRLEFVPNQSN